MNPETRLAQAFLEHHPRQAAERLGLADPPEVAAVLSPSRDEVVAEVLQHIDPVIAGRVIEAFPAERRPKVLAALPPRRAALLLADTAPETREAWLTALPDDLSRPLRAALAHPPDSVARLMDPAVLAAPLEMTAAQARELVAHHAQRAIYYLYVIDADRRAVGVLNLRELIGASPSAPLSTIMHAPVVTIPARASTVVAAVHPGWRTLHALPVVDDQGMLVGVLRYETGERIRGREDDSRAGGGVGVALSEVLWTLTAHVVDEVATAVRHKDDTDG